MGQAMKVALVIGLLALAGRTAEAQGRGTVQATATVVDTHQGFAALSAVRQAVTNSRIESKEAVATVAVVTSERMATKPNTVVVTVDFARN
jgi:CHASE3 domain sensor protein